MISESLLAKLEGKSLMQLGGVSYGSFHLFWGSLQYYQK